MGDPIYNVLMVSFYYFRELNIVDGFSKYDFHELENLATVAPSTTL
jgi:hypothetical protein